MNGSTKLGTSKLKTSAPSTTATITNSGGAIAGDADFYAWGLHKARTRRTSRLT